MFNFSRITLKCLQDAGWDEKYQSDISQYEQLMERENCPLPIVVTDFLRRFGNLVIKHPHFRVPNKEDIFHFDAFRAATTPKGKYCDDLKHYVQRVGTPLYVIGEASRGYILLMMNSEGRVYGSYDDFMIYVGASGKEAIEALCTGKQLPELP